MDTDKMQELGYPDYEKKKDNHDDHSIQTAFVSFGSPDTACFAFSTYGAAAS